MSTSLQGLQRRYCLSDYRQESIDHWQGHSSDQITRIFEEFTLLNNCGRFYVLIKNVNEESLLSRENYDCMQSDRSCIGAVCGVRANGTESRG